MTTNQIIEAAKSTYAANLADSLAAHISATFGMPVPAGTFDRFADAVSDYAVRQATKSAR